MKRINFKEFSVYTGISKKEKVTGDARESFANVLYTHLSGIRAKNLALKIFNSDGETELEEEDAKLITVAAETYCTPAFMDAINEQLEK
jgi:hypothetical protein